MNTFIPIITANDVVAFAEEFKKVNNNPLLQLKPKEMWKTLNEFYIYSDSEKSVEIITKASCCLVELIGRIGSIEIMKFVLANSNFTINQIINDQKYTILHVCIKYHHVNLFQYLLSLNNDFTKHKSNEWSLLSVAVKYNHLDIVTFLIENGHKVNEYFGDLNIVWFALTDKQADILELLLQNGADPNVIEDVTAEFPLLVAYQKKQYKVVELLFNYGAKIDYSTEHNESMLTESIRLGDIDMFKYLVARGVDIDTYWNRFDSKVTIADFIIDEKRYNFLKILIESGYKLILTRERFMSLIDLCIRCGKEFAKRPKRIMGPKRIAFYKELLDLVDLILERKVFNPKWVPENKEDISPLSCAIESENKDLATILVFNGADLDAVYLGEEISEDDPRKTTMELISDEYYEYRRDRSKFYRKRHEFEEDDSDVEIKSDTEVEEKVEIEEKVEEKISLNDTHEKFVKFDCKTFHVYDKSCDVFDEDSFFNSCGRRQEEKPWTTSDCSDEDWYDHEWEDRHKKYDDDDFGDL